jgi:hypothetical protein
VGPAKKKKKKKKIWAHGGSFGNADRSSFSAYIVMHIVMCASALLFLLLLLLLLLRIFGNWRRRIKRFNLVYAGQQHQQKL